MPIFVPRRRTGRSQGRRVRSVLISSRPSSLTSWHEELRLSLGRQARDADATCKRIVPEILDPRWSFAEGCIVLVCATASGLLLSPQSEGVLMSSFQGRESQSLSMGVSGTVARYMAEQASITTPTIGLRRSRATLHETGTLPDSCGGPDGQSCASGNMRTPKPSSRPFVLQSNLTPDPSRLTRKSNPSQAFRMYQSQDPGRGSG